MLLGQGSLSLPRAPAASPRLSAFLSTLSGDEDYKAASRHPEERWGPTLKVLVSKAFHGGSLPAVGGCGSVHGRSRWSGDIGPEPAAPSETRPQGLSQG